MISERNVEHYISGLSNGELSKIVIRGFRDNVEVCSAEEQDDILYHLSKIKADMEALGSNTEMPGAIILQLELYYADGREEMLTIPAFRYPTLLGERDFYLSINGEGIDGEKKLWAPFKKYFELLRE